MPRREDNRPLFTRFLHAVAKALVITSLGMAVGALFGDFGLSARVLGTLTALGVSGAAVAMHSAATHLEQQQEIERLQAIELENRKADALVAEMAAPDLVELSQLEESKFVHLVEERRQGRARFR